MKFKKNNWFDSKELKVFYGIDAKVDNEWHHAAEDGKPLLFDTSEERDEKLKELRKEYRESKK